MQKRLFGNILDFEKPVDFCHLSKVILESYFKHEKKKIEPSKNTIPTKNTITNF